MQPGHGDWTASVIWWHCYPLRFVGAEDRLDELSGEAPRHRLPQLIRWLDYVVELGCNGLLLGPVFASTSHGYDTLDYFRIDPRLGDDADFDRLVEAASERGIRLCLDGVFNHVSRDHPIVQRAMASGPGSEDGRWLRWQGEYPLCFEGNLDLVDLNLTDPVVQDYVAEVMTHWLDRGVDGWRLDAAFAPGAAAWRPVVERVRAVHPDAWLVGEVLQGDYLEFVAESGVDSVTQYELWKAIWSSLNDGNFYELDWALQRHATFTEVFRPQTFVGNHDVTRIATKLDDARHVPLATALLMTLPGIPTIYAGDEQAFTGEKRDQPRGDDAVRPPFPSDPSGLSTLGKETHERYAALVAFRRRNPWLVEATFSTSDLTNTTLGVHLIGAGDEHITMGLNVSDEQRTVAGLDVPPHGYRLEAWPSRVSS
jgi:cyclomaltodextrinase / maltogenic alpha-amylase / neopullulanase